MQLPESGKALLRTCVAAVAAFVLTIGAACSSSPGTAPGTSVTDATPPASPTPNDTPTPPPLEEAGFGGLFVDPDDKSILYIYLVNPSQAAAEEAAVKYFGRGRMQNIKEVRPLQAQYTLRQLSKWNNNELVEARLGSPPEVTLRTLSQGKNRIEVGVACESDLDKVRQELQKRLTLLGVPLDAVIFTVRPRAYPLLVLPPYECIPPEVIDPATGLSTPGFGGYYFDSGIAYVYLLEPSQEVAEELMLAQIGTESFERLLEVRALKGKYTWTQLTEWHESITADVQAIPATDIVSVSKRKNRLTIEVRTEQEGNTESKIKDVLSRHGVPYDAVILLGH